MNCQNPACLGKFDFERIAFFAKKRFVDGHSTISLMEKAESVHEQQEIALVSMLDIEDQRVRDLNLSCSYAVECKTTNCRNTLKQLIQVELDKKQEDRIITGQ